ncbi:DUF302 domain-containing protein [Lutimonas zeaxanthinifaciens]|uniref:DUF302 domain-containing protein n=1 Tax=Lutimonas zeaxanthinifaciens TaxID=3060215 RepID=UPI00265D0C76|nr:DUF302 domain-containing protein [Lutimonas sp. YSD2104]WKK65132.1 DUF302 domain-containing protein [Lutimonas sp. YSD2104]
MEYYINKTLNDISFEEGINKVTESLKTQGFGILTEIDLKTTLKNKLDVDFYNYKILGACNPPFAYQALQSEDKIGTMLPCNVIVQEKTPGKIEISAVDPMASMQAVENPELGDLAKEVKDRLQKCIDAL